MRAIRVHRAGGPDVLTVEEIDEPVAGRGQVVVDVSAAGVNLVDTQFRDGRKPVALPTGIGLEGAGKVAALGPGVDSVAIGDRVAWDGMLGSYAERLAVDVERLVQVPDGLSTLDAATALHQGITAHYLVTDTFPLSAGDTALVGGAAGGVGGLLVQFARECGARVIACTSTADKAAHVQALGADAVLIYPDQDLAGAVHRLTDGRGVDVVYESVGAATFDASLAALRVRGMLVLFGESSGRVPPVDPARLGARALYLTRPVLAAYASSREELVARAAVVFERARTGALRLPVHAHYALEDAARAHADIASRATMGKLLILPRPRDR